MADPLILYLPLTITNGTFNDTIGTDPPTNWTHSTSNVSNTAEVAAAFFERGSGVSMNAVKLEEVDAFADDPHYIYTDVSVGTGMYEANNVNTVGMWCRAFNYDLVQNIDPVNGDIRMEQIELGSVVSTSSTPTVYGLTNILGSDLIAAGDSVSYYTTMSLGANTDTIRFRLWDSLAFGFGGIGFQYPICGMEFDLANILEGYRIDQNDRIQVNRGGGEFEIVQLADPTLTISLQFARITPGSDQEAGLFRFLNRGRGQQFYFFLDRDNPTNWGRHFEQALVTAVSGVRESGGARGYKPNVQLAVPNEWVFQYNAENITS